MNQIALASVMMQLRMDETTEVSEDMVRHMILNSIRNYVMEFKSDYTDNDADIILAWDSKHYWRRDYYPQYKAGRRKGRQESEAIVARCEGATGAFVLLPTLQSGVARF